MTEIELLAKEQEEINTWARLVAQIFFAWYTVFLTFSGAALTWALAERPQLPWPFIATVPAVHSWGSKATFGMGLLLILSIMGILVSSPIMQYTEYAQKRVEEINRMILPSPHRVQSPIPLKTALAAYNIARLAMLVLAIIWAILLIKG